jgi:hypothetical protein
MERSNIADAHAANPALHAGRMLEQTFNEEQW